MNLKIIYQTLFSKSKDGIIAYAEQIYSKTHKKFLLDLIKSMGGGILDAPTDDKKYVRQNSNWVEETKIDTSTFLTKTEATQIYASKNDLTDKQNKTDNNLQTTDKTIVGAINELVTRLTALEGK